jgi:hypothetical protein
MSKDLFHSSAITRFEKDVSEGRWVVVEGVRRRRAGRVIDMRGGEVDRGLAPCRVRWEGHDDNWVVVKRTWWLEVEGNWGFQASP